jgi:hypothetical protein
MVGMGGGSNREGGFFSLPVWTKPEQSYRRLIGEGVALLNRAGFPVLPKRIRIQSFRKLRIPYRRKNDDSVDPAEAVSGFACAAGGCAAGGGAGSSRFEERFDE